MNLTVEKLEEFFERYGWTYTRESDDTWITGVRTRVSAFRIMVRITEHWVFFIINPLVVAPARKKDRVRVYYHALRYNLDMNFAKLGLDSDGDIFMAIEMPTENFAYSHFVDALDGLSHHASMVYAEIFGLAHAPERTEGRYDHELDAPSPYLPPWYYPGLEDYDEDDDDDDDPLDFEDDDDEDFDDEDYDDEALLDEGEIEERWRRALSGIETPTENNPIDSVSSDVFIAGRRLKIFDDDKGATHVELENTTEPEKGDDEQPKPDGESDSDKPDKTP